VPLNTECFNARLWLSHVAPRVMEQRPNRAEAYRLYEQAYSYHSRMRTAPEVTNEDQFVSFVTSRHQDQASTLFENALSGVKQSERLVTQGIKRKHERTILDSEHKRNDEALVHFQTYTSQADLE
jgi:hypothetical protein